MNLQIQNQTLSNVNYFSNDQTNAQTSWFLNLYAIDCNAIHTIKQMHKPLGFSNLPQFIRYWLWCWKCRVYTHMSKDCKVVHYCYICDNSAHPTRRCPIEKVPKLPQVSDVRPSDLNLPNTDSQATCQEIMWHLNHGFAATQGTNFTSNRMNTKKEGFEQTGTNLQNQMGHSHGFTLKACPRTQFYGRKWPPVCI